MSFKKLKDTWVDSSKLKEKFFISYAVNGSIVDPSMGLRAGLPVNHPISGPVSEPSPLNNRWVYSPPWPSHIGIL